MLYVYLVASAALIPILDIFFDILKESYSWWLVPVLFIGFFLGFIILHLAVFAVSALIVNPNTESEKGNKYYRGLVKYTLPMVFKLARVEIRVTGEDKRGLYTSAFRRKNDEKTLLLADRQGKQQRSH